MPDWHFGYSFNTDVVGESNYQRALSKCYKDEHSYKKGKSSFVDVDLVFERGNAYDSNAVAVKSQYGKIGYLSKDDAIRYRHLCEGSLETLSVRCKIYSGKQGLYGAWVDLDLFDLPASKQSLKKYNSDSFAPPRLSQSSTSEPVQNNSESNNKLFVVIAALVVIFIVSMIT